MKQKIIALSIIYLLVSSCKVSTRNGEKDTATVAVQDTETATAPTGDNTQNAVDWTGTYKGTTPCADCAGIETSLQLNRDNTYRLTTKYLGKRDTATQEKKGSFSWDAGGSVITLQGIKDAPTQYKVGEDMVVQYSLQGKEITGALADKYILQK